MRLQAHPALYIAAAGDLDRGVFTAESIEPGSIIEICPVIVLPPGDRDHIHSSRLHDYYFIWEPEGATAIALGYGSLYNHANDSNADYEMDMDARTLTVRCVRPIAAGDEITIDYTDGVNRDTLWF